MAQETIDQGWAWYARVEAGQRAALRGLRVKPGIEWLLEGEWLWLRGRGPLDQVAPELGRGGAAIFIPSDGDGLALAHPPGRRVPTAKVPSGEWAAAAEMVVPRAEAPMLAGTLPDKVPLGLARGGAAREAAAIRAPLGSLAEWALAAPEARLEPLTFFVDGSREVFVIGAPLPPIAGALYWCEAGVFVPAGMRFQPQVDARTARAVLARLASGAGAEDRFVLEERGAMRLPERVLLPVRRATLRATMAGLVGE